MTEHKIKQKVQIVVKTDEAVLLLKLNEKRGGIWQNATGSVEKNESYAEAAKRELLEETGISHSLIELPMEIQFHDQWGFDVIEKVFACHLHEKLKINISDEHQDYKWIEFSKLSPTEYAFENHFKAAMLAKENRL